METAAVAFELKKPTNTQDADLAVKTPMEAGFMVKADAKLAEKVEMRKGTIAIIALCPAVGMLLLSYGASMVGWVREDQSTKNRVETLQTSVNRLEQDLRDIKDALKALEIKEAYKLGAGTAHENERPKK